MQMQYGPESPLFYQQRDLERLISQNEYLIHLTQNNIDFDSKVVDTLKTANEALKLTSLKTNNTQAEIDVLNQAIQDSKKSQEQLLTITKKLIKNNLGGTSASNKTALNAFRNIEQTLYNSMRAILKLNYSLKGWKGQVSSIRTGDQQTTKALRASAQDEGLRDKQFMGAYKALNDQNLKVPTVAPIKTFNTSGDIDESSKSFWGKNGEKLSSVFLGITQIGAGLAQAMQSMLSQMGQAQSTLFSAVGDILDNPIQQIMGVLSGLSQSILQGFKMVSDIINSIIEGISSIFSIQGDKKEGNSQMIGKIVSVIGNLISSLVSMVVSQIQAGFSMFTSILTSVFKIIKKIQLTSPVIQQILDLMNVAFTLFFMPFMNAFGLKLLDSVVDILNWALENGKIFQDVADKLLSILSSQDFNLQSILNDVKDIAVSFVEDYLPEIIKLIPSITTFATDFVSQILKHSSEIISFIQNGFKVFDQIIETGVLSSFLEFGNDVMSWMSEHGKELVSFMEKAMSQALGLAEFFINFISTPQIGFISSAVTGDLEGMKKSIADLLSQQYNPPKNQSYVQYITNPFNKRGLNGFVDWLFGRIGDLFNGEDVPTQQAGGKFTPRAYNNGIPVLAGEQHEGEYRLNEKELKDIGKDTTVTIQYNGSILSRSDFKTVVQDAVSDVSNKSRFR